METKKTSKQRLGELVDQHYAEAMQAKKDGKLVAWATSISPQELLEAMDIHVVYPENHAAAIGARKCSSEFLEQAEGKGYSIDICSYARVNLGYKDIMHSEACNIPAPDVVFCCNNICTTVAKWYENLATELNIPFILIDMPFNHTYEATEHSIKYIRGQIEYAITQLEEITGRKMDYDKLAEVMKVSNETAKWWRQACFTAQAIPSPLNGFDMFNYMALAVCIRGKKEGRDLFKLWYEELAEKVRLGQGPWKENEEEKYRVIWDGIACWANLSPSYKILKKYGINVVTSLYPDAWSIFYETNDLEGMARAYTYYHANRNVDYVSATMRKLAEEFAIDGVIFHSNRSCKLMDFTLYEQQRRIEEKAGIPSVIFDGDMTDPRIFSEAQYETRIQALVEMMERKKAEKGGK
ncbi:2-hydroxyacyl-CoA dehydratase subunit D [Clostridium aminobutyricum]|uniref:2-hydroxyacyl-CoA dehydratase n=1 Tax=Clostridium aminobutyricum TaxID=33953 RepID=A0A939D9J8_CLOAM|nr:2-hydroxyacyl-CoA dehydratase family protein [Clostridium aminobutyricum]MBN7773572.1 2-hydroxyacyl-CoA dehydratase [Clostridium aminobutyricum]